MSKPNFCQKCGNSFEESRASTSDPTGDEADDENVEGFEAHLQGLDFDIVGNQGNTGVTLGALSQLAAPDNSNSPKVPKKKVPRTSKKKVLEQLKKEAGAIRPDNG